MLVSSFPRADFVYLTEERNDCMNMNKHVDQLLFGMVTLEVDQSIK